MASTGDVWMQWFSCCFHQPQSPSRRRSRHQHMRIDRSMIGVPTNFVHTGTIVVKSLCLHIAIFHNCDDKINDFFSAHIGSNDAELSSHHINALQSQMQSKGGYEINSLRIQVSRIITKYFLAGKFLILTVHIFIPISGMLTPMRISGSF